MAELTELVISAFLFIMLLMLGAAAAVGTFLLGLLYIPMCGLTGDPSMCSAAHGTLKVLGWIIVIVVGGFALVHFIGTDIGGRFFDRLGKLLKLKSLRQPETIRSEQNLQKYDEWIEQLPALRRDEQQHLRDFGLYMEGRGKLPNQQIRDIFINALVALSPIHEDHLPRRDAEYPHSLNKSLNITSAALARYFEIMKQLYNEFLRVLPAPAFTEASEEGLSCPFSSFYTEHTALLDAFNRAFTVRESTLSPSYSAYIGILSLKYPERYEAAKAGKEFADDTERMAYVLRNTPFAKLLDIDFPFVIPEEKWDQHGIILAPPGTGKTQTIQYFLSCDLTAVERNERTVVVMDSTGDLFKQIRYLECFAPGGSLEDKLLILEPNVEHPLQLNPFSMNKHRVGNYSPRMREQLSNQTFDLLTYIISALGEGTTLTGKQSTLFSYCVQLLVQIPKATLNTFAEILANGTDQYQQYVDQLPPAARAFFENQFSNPKQWRDTRHEVANRITYMVQNRTFAEMLCAPECAVDLFSEFSSSKVILINTDRALLGKDRTALLGRLWFAMILNAATERTIVDREDRLPVRFYVDEFHDYGTDPKIPDLLDTARKMRVGMVAATQRLSNIGDPNIRDALLTSSIRIASTDNHSDASVMAKAMATTPEFIIAQSRKKEHFAFYIRGLTTSAISLRVPFLVLEKMSKMTEHDHAQIMKQMYARYSDGVNSEKPEWKRHARDEVRLLPKRDDPYDDPDNVDMSAR